MYIVYTEHLAHCVHDVIIGICKNMNEVIETIWTFSRFRLHILNEEFCENMHIIKIKRIVEQDFNILESLYKKYIFDIEEYVEHNPLFKGYFLDSFDFYYLYGVYDTEDDCDIIFSKDDCKIIKNIIDKSILLI
jgi:hypothetical protein